MDIAVSSIYIEKDINKKGNLILSLSLFKSQNTPSNRINLICFYKKTLLGYQACDLMDEFLLKKINFTLGLQRRLCLTVLRNSSVFPSSGLWWRAACPLLRRTPLGGALSGALQVITASRKRNGWQSKWWDTLTHARLKALELLTLL